MFPEAVLVASVTMKGSVSCMYINIEEEHLPDFTLFFSVQTFVSKLTKPFAVWFCFIGLGGATAGHKKKLRF